MAFLSGTPKKLNTVALPALQTARGYVEQGVVVQLAHSIIDRRCSCNGDPCLRPGRHLIADETSLISVLDEKGLAAAWNRHPYARSAILAGGGSVVALEVVGDSWSALTDLGESAGLGLLLRNVIEMTGPDDRYLILFKAPAMLVTEPLHAISDRITLIGKGSWLLAPDRSADGCGSPAWRSDGVLEVSRLPELPEWIADLIAAEGKARNNSGLSDSYFSLASGGKVGID